MGILRGFHPCHIDTLDFALCRMDFLAECFRGRFSVALTVLTAEKHTLKIRGKIRWENSVKTFRSSVHFLVRFSVHFSVRFAVNNFLPRNREKSCRILSAREAP